eukprot:TRINITY_DN3832_c0_g1_i2.p1 TRINITY_DN3832_c0_g1~~TRINITY_DN3832_c0_g1_i2.p1  ORF type:complete len:600 (+),score=142.13 TRINITY_DN3832_c0_g1_i2:52-1851(+)
MQKSQKSLYSLYLSPALVSLSDLSIWLEKHRMSSQVETTQINEEQIKEANQQLKQAIALINGDKVGDAVTLLGQVVNTYVSKYGQTAPECAPIYFRLGQALLFQAQDAAKNTVGFDVAEKQGLSLEDYDEDEDEDFEGDTDSDEACEEADENDQTAEQECGPSSSLTTNQVTCDQLQKQDDEQTPKLNDHTNDTNINKVENQIGEEEQKQSVEQQQEDETKQKMDGNVEEKQTLPNASEDVECGDTKVEEEEEEELTGWEADLQLAWQNLEVARSVYEKYAGERNKTELAEIHLCLGDVSAEREDFDSAIADYKICLDYFNSIEKPSQKIQEDTPAGATTTPATDENSAPKDTTTAAADDKQDITTEDKETEQEEKEQEIITTDEHSLRIVRRKAEAYFKLALVLQFSMMYEESEQNIEVALDILCKHHEACKQAIESASEEEIQNLVYIKKYLEDLPGTIDDLKSYQEELKQFRNAGSLAGLQAAIKRAQQIADDENKGGEEPSTSKVEEPKVVQDLGVFGRSKKKQNPMPLSEQNKEVLNTENVAKVLNTENVAANNDTGKRIRDDGEKKSDCVEGESVAVKKLKIDEAADTSVQQN